MDIDDVIVGAVRGDGMGVVCRIMALSVTAAGLQTMARLAKLYCWFDFRCIRQLLPS